MSFDYNVKVDDAHERIKFYLGDHLVADVAFKRERPLISLFTTYVPVDVPGLGRVFINANSLKKRTFDLLNKDARIQTLFDRIITAPESAKTTELRRLLDGVAAIRSSTKIDLTTATALQKADEDIVLTAIIPEVGESNEVAASRLTYADPSLLSDLEFIKKAIKANPAVINLPFPGKTNAFLAECLNDFPNTAEVIDNKLMRTLTPSITNVKTMQKIIIRDSSLLQFAIKELRQEPRIQTMSALFNGNDYTRALKKEGRGDVNLSFIACGVSSRHSSPGMFYYPIFYPIYDSFEAPMKIVPRETWEKIHTRFEGLSRLVGVSLADKAKIRTAEFCHRALNLWSDSERLKTACRENGLAYLFASDDARNDREIITIAVKKNPEVLDLLPPSIKRDAAFIRGLLDSIITEQPLNLEFIPTEFLSKGLVLKAVRSNRHAFDFARGFQEDDDIRSAGGIRPSTGGGARGATAAPTARASAAAAASSHPLEDSILKAPITFAEMLAATGKDKEERHRIYRLATGCEESENVARHFKMNISRQYHPDKLIGQSEEIVAAKEEIFKVFSILAGD